MSKESEKELLPPLPPAWAVITCTRRQTKQEIALKTPKIISHHELLYGGRVITKMTGQAGLDKLHIIAKFSNKQCLAPRRNAVECVADDTGTMEARLKRQTARADALQEAIRNGTITPTGTP